MTAVVDLARINRVVDRTIGSRDMLLQPRGTKNPALRLAVALVTAAVSLLLFLAPTHRANAAEKPNIIFIFTDDMGYADAGCYGGTFAPTPNIDALAKEGTRFTQFYVASPICSPSRAAVITGMHPARWHIHTFLNTRAGNRAAGQADFLDPKAPSIARALKQAGYVTAHIGKWHLGGGRDVTNAPLFAAYGYDEHTGTYESPQPDPNLTASDWIWSADDPVKRWNRTAYFVDKTLDFLKRNKGKPCFVNLWPDDMHTPWIPEGAIPRRGRNEHESEAEFKLVLAEYDRQIGRLMAGLKELALDEDTLVMFSSDNGPGPDFQDNPRSLGMRGRKGSLYEGGIRMPLIVRWPKKIPAARVDDKTILNAVDLFPTLCRIAGAPGPGDQCDGQDMSRAFHGDTVERHAAMFWQFNRRTSGARAPSHKDISPSLAIRERNWKLLVNEEGLDPELYDLDRDRNETTNIAAENPEIARRLTKKLLDWKASLP